jgi:pimeloyl-ACP methyl ester carboxylesterase
VAGFAWDDSEVLLPHDDQGTGPVILLLHAGVADRRMWSEQLKPLAAAGYRVVALDLPGFGEAPMAVEQDAPWLDVLETLDWLGVERAAVVGNSFGGLVAQRIAVLAPSRLWALALVSSPDDALDPSPRLRAVWEAEEAALEMEDFDSAVQIMVEAWTLPEASARLRLRVARMQRRAYELGAQDGETPEGPDPLERDPGALARLELPTLIARGEHDMSDFHASAERLAATIPGARSTVIPGAGHLAPMERPKAFREELVGFLEQAQAEEIPT